MFLRNKRDKNLKSKFLGLIKKYKFEKSSSSYRFSRYDKNGEYAFSFHDNINFHCFINNYGHGISHLYSFNDEFYIDYTQFSFQTLTITYIYATKYIWTKETFNLKTGFFAIYNSMCSGIKLERNYDYYLKHKPCICSSNYRSIPESWVIDLCFDLYNTRDIEYFKKNLGQIIQKKGHKKFLTRIQDIKIIFY